jgi:hypothetical protein
VKRALAFVCTGLVVLGCAGTPSEDSTTSTGGSGPGSGAPADASVCLKDLPPNQRDAAINAWVGGPLPSEVGGTQDCHFEDFAWQSFLALTKAVDGGYLFTEWGNSQDLFPAQGEPPPFPSGSGARAVKAYQMKTINSGALALSDQPIVEDTGGGGTTQEAATLVPLVDQRGRWVHYSIFTNETEYDFVRSQGLYASDCYGSWGGDTVDAVIYCPESKQVIVDCTGKTKCTDTGVPTCATDVFPSPLPTLPTGAVELKLAWQVLETCNLPDSPTPCTPDDPSTFITAPGEVAPYSPTVPGPTAVTLGLVGMHILHKTPNHPDWVWTTFEHRQNDPDCASLDAGDWLFYGEDEKLNMFCTPCPIDYKTVWPSYVQAVEKQLTASPPQAVVDGDGNLLCSANPAAFNLASPPFYDPGTGSGQCAGDPIPTQVCRSSTIPTDVQDLNGYVKGVLDTDQPVLANYQLVGALYLDSSCAANASCRAEGDTNLSNTTMETYLQQINCLVCHGANQFNPSPYDLKPYAGGIADRSFLMQRIQEAQLPDGVECTAPKASYTCPTCPKPSSTAGGR